MKYYTVTGTSEDTRYPLRMTHVSEMSLKGIRRAFAGDGIEVYADYAYTTSDHPAQKYQGPEVDTHLEEAE